MDLGNPFGIMTGKSGSLQSALQRAKELGVSSLELPTVRVDRWMKSGPVLQDTEALENSGLKVILTIRSHDVYESGRGGISTTPPLDIEAYRNAVGQILDAYKPQLLLVEDEEDIRESYKDGVKAGVWGTIEDKSDSAKAYQEKLDVACEVAHSRGVKCANGGLTSEAAALLTWMGYLEHGDIKQACDFARRAFYSRNKPRAGEQYCKVNSINEAPLKVRNRIDHIEKRLLQVCRDGKNDYTNFHWYIHDPEALKETAAYLRRATGKPAMISEIGQRKWDASPDNVQPLMQAVVEAGLPYALWSAADTEDAGGFFKQNGQLRLNGIRFREFIKARY
jgi:hypothetical protein